MDHARRRFIGAAVNDTDKSVNLQNAPLRPPWALAEPLFLDNCTKCHACISACPEAIIRIGGGQYPVVDFTNGACSFCEACVEACNDHAFSQPTDTRPWQHVASASSDCLAQKGVSCQSCQDSCEPRAISFKPRIGAPSLPEFSDEDCTGCGACLSVCPSNAIVFVGVHGASVSMSVKAKLKV